jgi:hypothetical protein
MFKNASYHPSGRRSLLTRGLLWVFFFGFLASAHAQYTATVDLNTKYQTFEGWGTSLAWWANVVGAYPDSCSGATNCSTRGDYVARVFDPTYGLGFNVVRYNIGGGENPLYLPPNTSYLQYRARVPGFLSSASAQYDWTQDANQRWVLQQAIQHGVTIAEAFSNSPPWWMTNSGSVSGAKDGGNNLNPAYASAFADYLTSVAQHYHDTWGITFRTIEPFNEPVAGWWKFGGNQEGCGFDRATQNSFVKTLGASLAAKNMSYASVSASDENSIDDAVMSLNAMDATAQGYMGQVNTHSYNGSQRTQLATATANASKRLWMSEYGDSDATGMTMAYQILNDLQNLQPKSWTYWQAVDNSGGWGFMSNVLDGSSNSGYSFNQKYYVMAQFSKFLRPGYQFVSISDTNSVAAYDGQGTVAIVTASNNSSDQLVTYNIQNMTSGMGTGPWNVTPFRSSASDSVTAEKLVALPSFQTSNPTFTATVAANSVTTFVITNPTTVPLVDGAQYAIYTQWGYTQWNDSSNLNVQALQETNRVSGQATAAPGVQLVTDGSWPNGVLGASNIDHIRVWTAHNAGGNKWVFTNLHSEDNGTPMAMDIAGTGDNAEVIQNPRTDVPSQQWTVVPGTDAGTYRINPVQSNLSLHMTGWWGGGVNLCTEADSSCDDGWSPRYEWHFVPFQGSAVATQSTLGYTSPVYNTSDEQLSVTITTASTNLPTGTVTFYDGEKVLATTTNIIGGVASFDAGKLSLGTHNIAAVYSGDATNAPSSTGYIPILCKPGYLTTTTLTSSANPATPGQNITFNMGVSSDNLPFTGSFTLTSNGTTLATLPLTNYAASYSTNTLTPGAYQITATYTGDASHLTSSATVLQEVNAAGAKSSTVTMSTSQSTAAPIFGQPLTLNASVSGSGGTPTGTVYFLEGSTIVASGAVNSSGAATATTSSLAVGTHSLTAYYEGDANFSASSSSTDSVQIYAVPVGDYAVGTSVSSLSVTGSTDISIVTSGGFNQPVTFSCSGLPSGYTCNFSPASLTPSSAGIVTTHMTISGQSSAALEQRKATAGFVTALAGLGFLGLPLCWRFRRRMGLSIILLALIGTLGLAVTGCSSTTPKAYTVTVTATSLPLARTVQVQVLK